MSKLMDYLVVLFSKPGPSDENAEIERIVALLEQQENVIPRKGYKITTYIYPKEDLLDTGLIKAAMIYLIDKDKANALTYKLFTTNQDAQEYGLFQVCYAVSTGKPTKEQDEALEAINAMAKTAVAAATAVSSKPNIEQLKSTGDVKVLEILALRSESLSRRQDAVIELGHILNNKREQEHVRQASATALGKIKWESDSSDLSSRAWELLGIAHDDKSNSSALLRTVWSAMFGMRGRVKVTLGNEILGEKKTLGTRLKNLFRRK